MIFSQALRNIRRTPLISAASVLMMSLGLFLIIGSVGYYSQNQTKISDFYKAYGPDTYKYKCQFFGFAEKGSEAQWVNEMFEYKEKLFSDDSFDTYVFNDGYLLKIADYKGSDTCLNGYEDYRPERDKWIGSVTGNRYSNAKAYVISPSVFEQFGIKTAVGTDFSDFDCRVSDDMTVPVVMGWEYRDYYKLGEVFQALLPYREETLCDHKVVGFLPPDAAYISSEGGGHTVSLARTLLYPALDISDLPIPDPVQQKKEYYAFEVYINNLCCFILDSDDNSLKLDSSYAPQTIMIASPTRTMSLTSDFLKASNEYFKMLLMASVLIIAGTAICLSLNLTGKLLSSFRTYAIHQISGGTLMSIKLMMAAECLMLLGAADIIAFVCAALFGSKVFTYNQTTAFGISVTEISPVAALAALAVTVAVGAAAVVVPMIKLDRAEFDTLLRGRE